MTAPTEPIAAPRGRWVAFAPLRHRNFALVWSAALISNVGTWMETVAVGVGIVGDKDRGLIDGRNGGIARLESPLPHALSRGGIETADQHLAVGIVIDRCDQAVADHGRATHAIHR